MRRSIILFIFIAAFINANAQQSKQSERAKFKLISSVGFAAGETNTKPLFQIIGGVEHKRYFGGIGVGADFYQFHSIPVFADFRISALKNRMLFGYLDAGFNFPINVDESENPWFPSTNEYVPGYYMDAGVGCRIAASKKSSFSLSVGYSIKRIDREQSYQSSWRDPDLLSYTNYEYTMRRLLCKLSWEFGK